MANEYGDFWDAVNDDTEWQFACSVIRLTDGYFYTHPDYPEFYYNTGAYVHANAAHVNVGITEILFDKDYDVIRLLAPGTHVGAVGIWGDETCVQKRMMFGCSGGNSRINVTISTDEYDKYPISNATKYRELAEYNLNFWLLWAWPKHRGDGGPDRVDKLSARLDALESEYAQRLAALESFHPFLVFDETEFA